MATTTTTTSTKYQKQTATTTATTKHGAGLPPKSSSFSSGGSMMSTSVASGSTFAAPAPASAVDTTTNATTTTNGEEKSQQQQSSSHRRRKQKGQHVVVPSHISAIRGNPLLLGIPLALFITVLGAGIAIIIIATNAAEDETENAARLLAHETGNLFSDQLNKAIAPLYSLAQFVHEITSFERLHDEIGSPYTIGSAPFIDNDPFVTHRNVSGICDNPQTVSKYNEIAATMKRTSGLGKALVNLQLAPNAVVCLSYPLNNTEDFENGIYMDNTGIIGHDLLTDPDRSFIGKATVPSESVVIAGPLTLKQCQDCHPTVEKAFIARLPILSESHQIAVDGIDYNRWGFAVALINWKMLVEESGIYENFQERGLTFRLTRTDRIENVETGEITEKVVGLAESSNFIFDEKKMVLAKLQTTNNEWEMWVNYGSSTTSRWTYYAYALSIFFATSFAILVYIVMLQRYRHDCSAAEKTKLLIEQSDAAAKSQRDLNEFLAHEVRNPLSLSLSACAFLGFALQNKAQPLDLSREMMEEDVATIDTSLHFINDLLRNLIDTNRASNHHLELNEASLDIRVDIFEPVASMVQRRGSGYVVVVDCPEGITVKADKLRMQQIVLNLSRNSAKFVEKGFIRLRATVDEDDGNVFLYVEDSGPGIPQEKQDKLFIKYQETLDDLGQGTGVGLSLCKSLMDLMGGTICLDSSYKSGIADQPGSCFVLDLNRINESTTTTSSRSIGGGMERLQLPDTTKTTTTKSSPSPEEASSIVQITELPGVNSSSASVVTGTTTTTALPSSHLLPSELSVLFVDDDSMIRKLAVRAISKMAPNWKVRQASSGEAALKITEEEEFDIIWMDQYMTCVGQTLKGTETVRSMRSRGIESVICGLSANNMEPGFLDAGADAFQLKPLPCKPDALYPLLLKLVTLSRQRQRGRPTITSTTPAGEDMV